jgi:transcriptional regulator with XRE-family HTH domain
MSANAATYATIGAWIKQRRAALGLTQLQLASKSNCSLSVIRRLERNDYAPSQEIIDCLAKALEIARDDLECFSMLAQEGNSHDIPTVPE